MRKGRLMRKIGGGCAALLLLFFAGCAAKPVSAPAEERSASAAVDEKSSAAAAQQNSSQSQEASLQKESSQKETSQKESSPEETSQKESSQEEGAESGGSSEGGEALSALSEEETAGLTDYFMGFAESYSIVTLDIPFTSPEKLSEAEKYTIFLFLQTRFHADGKTLEQELYSKQEGACIIPLRLVNDYLQEYLGTEISRPEAAIGRFDQTKKRGYDSERAAFIESALSGFGGYREFSLLDSELQEDVLTLHIGSSDELGVPPTEERVRMRVRIFGLHPLRFQLLSWDNL